jgi:hypothetical protein
LDFLRLDASQVFSININQTIMAIVSMVAIGVLLWRHRPVHMTAAKLGQEPVIAPPASAVVARKAKSVARKGVGVTRRTTARMRRVPTLTPRKPARRK